MIDAFLKYVSRSSLPNKQFTYWSSKQYISCSQCEKEKPSTILRGGGTEAKQKNLNCGSSSRNYSDGFVTRISDVNHQLMQDNSYDT